MGKSGEKWDDTVQNGEKWGKVGKADVALMWQWGKVGKLPDQSVLDSDEFLRKFHHALLELHLQEGALVCPETGRRFPVNKGTPNMLLHEDEV
ncbi:hypothetical protein R6Q59_014632 [Mikania micrantha]